MALENKEADCMQNTLALNALKESLHLAQQSFLVLLSFKGPVYEI